MKKNQGFFLFSLIVLILVTGFNLRAEIFYPWKNIFIGALDPKAWPGMVIVSSPNSAFAFSPKVYRQDQMAEFEDFFYLISEVGPHSPDGLYASMKFDLRLPFKKGRETPIFLKPSLDEYVMLIEWSRRDEQTVIGKYRFPSLLDRITLVFYFPWDFNGHYHYLPESDYIHGKSAVMKSEHYLCWLSLKPEEVEPVANGLYLTFNIGKETELYFVASVGESMESINEKIYRFRSGGAIDDFLKEEKKAYSKKRLQISGLYEGSAEAITNNLFWMTLYQNGYHRYYTPAGRNWIFPRSNGQPDHWTIFEWDSFFNSLQLLVENVRLASDTVKAVLQTQYPNGNIPNWRGRFGGTPDRSQPPVGSFTVLKLFLRTGDEQLLKFAYPYLKKWHNFWTEYLPEGHYRRDGNNDGLLEWGSDSQLVAGEVPPWEKEAGGKQRAKWESGQDDLPNWDEASYNEQTGTLEMNCLDLNSLYALDCYCLAQLAQFLGYKDDNQKYLQEYEKIKNLVNQFLWNENEGFYFDRHWDGRFSSRKAASNFFPLIARIPDEDRALKMLRHLLNPAEFWGDYVLPTISRDDPAFNDQQYWRGAIWPPTNYLVYQGLKAYGLDLVAADFVKKSTDLFLRIWENYQLCPENFDSRTGEASGQRYQSWGPLFALMGVEEYLDVTPWDGFRFGQLNPESKGVLRRLSVLDRHYEVEMSSKRIKLNEEGRELLNSNGPAVFRHFLYTAREISFEVKSLKKRKISVNLGNRKKGQIFINGREAGKFDGKRVVAEVPEGEHRVVIIISE